MPDIEGVELLSPKIFPDERGRFYEVFRAEDSDHTFVQDNVSESKKGVLRGLHYQVPPFGQGKLVTVLQGKARDVIVDVRADSPTFGKHMVVELSAEDAQQLWIPPGCAHGFVALTDAIVFYKCTSPYRPEHERVLSWNDSELGIDWGVVPQVSERDAAGSSFAALKQELHDLEW